MGALDDAARLVEAEIIKLQGALKVLRGEKRRGRPPKSAAGPVMVPPVKRNRVVTAATRKKISAGIKKSIAMKRAASG